MNHASKFLKGTKATVALSTNFMKDNALDVYHTVGGSQQE